MSIKVTPYYRYATQQLDEAVFIPRCSLARTQHRHGVEFRRRTAVHQGRLQPQRPFRRLLLHVSQLEGAVGQLSGLGVNAVSPYNQYIQEYNALTKAGGGAQCYSDQANTRPRPGCGKNAILNPYYNAPLQPLLDPNAWYVTGLDFPYTSPNVFALVLNYKHDRFSITPALTLNEGAAYGNPSDFQGLDPRVCTANQGSVGIANPNPHTADYTSCTLAATPSGSLYIPNPETGSSIRSASSRSRGSSTWACKCTTTSARRCRRTSRSQISSTRASAVRTRRGAGSSRPATRSAATRRTSSTSATSTTGRARMTSRRTASRSIRSFKSGFSPSYGDVNSFNYPLPINFYIQLQVKL